MSEEFPEYKPAQEEQPTDFAKMFERERAEYHHETTDGTVESREIQCSRA